MTEEFRLEFRKGERMTVGHLRRLCAHLTAEATVRISIRVPDRNDPGGLYPVPIEGAGTKRTAESDTPGELQIDVVR